MGSTLLTAKARHWTAIVAIMLAGMLSACGAKGGHSQIVSAANAEIVQVDDAGKAVADAIANLSNQEAGERDLDEVREASKTYLAATGSANDAIRKMGTLGDQLQDHVQHHFLVDAEGAASDCQHALKLLRNNQIGDQDLRDAITLLGRCIDRYADAVESLSKLYRHISDEQQKK